MLLPVPFLEQGWHVVCQRVRRVHLFLSWGMLFLAFFFFFFIFLASSWCLVHMESTSFASLLVVCKAWVTSVCRGHYLCNLRGEC